MKNNNESTLKVLGQIYSWIGLSAATYLLLVESVEDNFFLVLKMVLMLAFMYNKNNWRMLVLCLSAFTVIWSTFALENVLGLIDILGFSVIFWYALKYRK